MNEAIGKLNNFKGAAELGEKLNQLEEVLKQAKMAPFDVCALGNIRTDSRETIRYLVGKKASRHTFKTIAKIAISASYYIFNRRRSLAWETPELFERSTVKFDPN